MSNNLPEDFRERAFRFTCKLFDFCDDLARSPGPCRTIANQLFDACSSIVIEHLDGELAGFYGSEWAAHRAVER